jgi:dephospho-CoA kinase
MEFNRAKFNISSYLYLFTEEKFADVSSTKARNAAQELNFIELSRLVAPMVVSALLEKVLGAENFWMVVGKPGGGKSTFLRLLSEADPQNIVINTDEFNQILRPLADQAFPNEDLIEVALRRPAELASVIGRTWLELLKDKLLNMPRVKNVFVEVAYGLRPENSVFRFLGGKILYLGCRSESHRKRLIERGASELLPFVEKIPGLKESEEIAQRYRLKIELIDTEGSLEDLARQAQRFLTNLKKGDDHVESVLAGFAGALGG